MIKVRVPLSSGVGLVALNSGSADQGNVFPAVSSLSSFLNATPFSSPSKWKFILRKELSLGSATCSEGALCLYCCRGTTKPWEFVGRFRPGKGATGIAMWEAWQFLVRVHGLPYLKDTYWRERSGESNWLASRRSGLMGLSGGVKWSGRLALLCAALCIPGISDTLFCNTSSFIMHHKGGFHKKEKAITPQVVQKIIDISEFYYYREIKWSCDSNSLRVTGRYFIIPRH